MAVYFKFKSAKEYDSVAIDGHFISVGNLKDRVIEKKNLGRGSDFDLVISNAQTNEEYIDEGFLIPKNTSVLIRRVPGRSRMPIITDVKDEKPVADPSKQQLPSFKNGVEFPVSEQAKQVEESGWLDEFGMDLYTPPEDVLPSQSSAQAASKTEEDSKIKAFVDASASDWQRQTQEGFNSRRGYGRGGGSQGRGVGGRGFGRGPEKTVPPPGYTCYRCNVSGHYIQHCPTNGDPTYDIKRVKPPTGIPKSMLVANPDGFYALPSGGVGVLRPNEAAFDKAVEGLPSNRQLGDIPPEFCCPLCANVLRDAVLTSKCCFKSYCDECIRYHIIHKGGCICGATSTLADDLLPNKTLREAIDRFLKNATTTNSAENAGSRHLAQDMESARGSVPKVPSPSASVSHVKTTVTLPPSDGSSVKEDINAKKPVIQLSQKPMGQKRAESQGQVLESVSVREQPSQDEGIGVQSASQAEEEVQQHVPAVELGKKRKKKGRPNPKQRVNEGPLRGGSVPMEFSGDVGMVMPYVSNLVPYNNFWGAQQWPMDASCMQPTYPYVGYGEMQYGPMMTPDMYSNAFMQPVPPFQREPVDYGKGNFPSGRGILSREEFEARKEEMKRRRDTQQRFDDSAFSSVRDCRELARDLNSERGESSSGTKRKTSSAATLGRKHMEADKHDDNDGDAERHPTGHKIGSSLSPRALRNHRHHQGDDFLSGEHTTLLEDSRVPSNGDDERLDRRPRGSVFSRISFPERTQASVERHHDNSDLEADAQGYDLGPKRVRMNGRIEKSRIEKLPGTETLDRSKHGLSQQDDSYGGIKVRNGKRMEYEEDGFQALKKNVKGGRLHDDNGSSDEGVNNKQTVKGRQMYSNSKQDNTERNARAFKEGNPKPVRMSRV